MGIPQGYAETESGSGAFASSDGSATLQVGFYDKAADFPVYTPVSYTHLDVYKRQCLHIGTRLQEIEK